MGQYRIFAVCQLMAKAFAISQQTAKVPRGAQLCNLGSSSWPYSLFLICFLGGRRQRRGHRGGGGGVGRRQRVEGVGGGGRWQRVEVEADGKEEGEADGKASVSP